MVGLAELVAGASKRRLVVSCPRIRVGGVEWRGQVARRGGGGGGGDGGEDKDDTAGHTALSLGEGGVEG